MNPAAFLLPGFYPKRRRRCYAKRMRTRTIFTIFSLLAAAGVLAEAYTWTDEQGVVHYSDRPHPGAKIVDLGESNSSRSSRPDPRRNASTDTAADAADETNDNGYSSLEIASPAAEETLWNIGGTLDVSLTLSPSLRPGHQVRIYFDGTPVIVRGANFQLDEVYRGVHNLQAEVIDETGKLMIRSRPSRFYVPQNSIQ